MDKDFNCIILEDDINSVRFVEEVIISNFPEVEILATIASVKEGKKQLLELQPDFVVLDINLSDGDAFDLLSEIENITFKILFITAHNKYAVEAFKFSALDFLLKPLSPKTLIASLNKIIEELQNQHYHNQLEAFFHNFKTSGMNKKLVLKNLDAVHIVDLKEIVYIKSDNNYSTFFLSDNRKILVSQTLKSFDEKLDGHYFFRCHQSYLINLNCIRSIDKTNDTIKLSTDDSVPVAQSKKKVLVEFLEQLQ
jgi:two-component system LytT family response regulator